MLVSRVVSSTHIFRGTQSVRQATYAPLYLTCQWSGQGVARRVFLSLGVKSVQDTAAPLIQALRNFPCA